MSTAVAIHATVPQRDVTIDLDLPGGHVLALLGANGSGKSTAIGLAAGTLRPGTGQVWIGDRQVAGDRHWVPAHERHISLLAQEPLLLPHLDVMANVAFGPRARGQRRAEARVTALDRLAEVGMTHLARRRPRELSGGQQQRVALARALAPEPQLLLLDEPLSALDVDAAAELRQVLRASLREAGRTAVVVTHDLLDVLALADAVVVLEDGRVVEDGPALQVLTRPRSDFAARFAGVNLLVGSRLDAAALQVDDGPLVLHGLPDGSGRPGERAAATFSPRAVSVHREPPGGSPRNAVSVQISGIEQQGELVRVRGKAPAGARLIADITAYSVATLGLGIGQQAIFVVKAAEVSIYSA